MFNFLVHILLETVSILADSSIYLLFGFFAAGLIHAYFPENKIVQYFGGSDLRSVFNAGILGIPLPLCSCSVIPTAIALRKSGASRGSTVSFLISTPETGVDSIGISFALLDPLMAVFRPIAALVTALTAGVGTNLLEKNGAAKSAASSLPEPVSACDCEDDSSGVAGMGTGRESRSLLDRIRVALRFSFGELLNDLAPWLVIGFLAAGLISVIIPDDFFDKSLGTSVYPMLLMLIVGIPLYICATASTPVAAALILKGLSPGAALVFLLVGSATNIGALILLSRYIEKKFLVLYLLTIAIMSLALGGLLNLIYGLLNLNIRATLGSGSEIFPGWLEVAGGVTLGILLFQSLLKAVVRRRTQESTKNI